MSGVQKTFLFVWFYVGWFACIYLGKSSGETFFQAWMSLFLPIPAFLILARSKSIKSLSFLFLIGLAIVGMAFDQIVFSMGLIEFPGHSSAMIPVWLISMWLLFVTVFPLSFEFLQSKLIIASIAAAISGPLSYYSGEAFEVLKFSSFQNIFVYVLFWGIFFPVSLIFYRRTL